HYCGQGDPPKRLVRAISYTIRGCRAAYISVNYLQINTGNLVKSAARVLPFCFAKGENHQLMKNLSTKISGAILTLAFIFGISAVFGMTAQAQNRRDRDDQRDDSRRDRDSR